MKLKNEVVLRSCWLKQRNGDWKVVAIILGLLDHKGRFIESVLEKLSKPMDMSEVMKLPLSTFFSGFGIGDMQNDSFMEVSEKEHEELVKRGIFPKRNHLKLLAGGEG